MNPHRHDDGQFPSVTVVTHSPSPYQVELFDAVHDLQKLRLKVVYLYARDTQRLWQGSPPRHENVMLTQSGVNADGVLEEMDSADLVVINYYKHPVAKAAMRRRAAAGAAMCFWGERPQARPMPGMGRLLRRWRLRPLLRCPAPVWGIGRMAVDAYRREFGAERSYVNLPYFSDLARFSEVAREVNDENCVFLFSGSLTRRKGVDILAAAFARLVRDFPQVRLRVMGSGEREAGMRALLQGCMGRVEFIGFRDWKDLPAEYAQVNFLCVPSRHDGWGMVVPEGLAAGLPVISTHQTGAAVEFIRPEQNGWLIPGDDAEALYRTMKDAATLTAGQWSGMSLLARESVSGHSLHHGAERFIEAATAALDGWPRSHGNTATPAGSS